jgi:hypothetical protein
MDHPRLSRTQQVPFVAFVGDHGNTPAPASAGRLQPRHSCGGSCTIVNQNVSIERTTNMNALQHAGEVTMAQGYLLGRR